MARIEPKEKLRRAVSVKEIGPLTLSLKELAGVLGVSYFTARELVLSGKIRSKRLGRRILVPISAVEEFLNSGEEVARAGH